jgi:hypothetical protein
VLRHETSNISSRKKNNGRKVSEIEGVFQLGASMAALFICPPTGPQRLSKLGWFFLFVASQGQILWNNAI